MNPPRVFISYSHDSAVHKKWVLDFATTLRNRGVDAVLDQWDLKPGDDLPHFMETQLREAQFVIMVCTEEYVKKANVGKGGVGYEKMIMTSSLLSEIDNSKVIPIIRQKGTDERPTFLSSKLYINFSNDSELEYSLDDLLRVLLNAPLYEKPEIGLNHFKPLDGSRPDRTSDGLKEVMKAIAATYEGTSNQYIYFQNVVPKASMHRLTLDRYLKQAVKDGLVKWHGDYALSITDDGLNYLFAHGIIEE
ncbi:toll/interleukin-1 receptor domain-containing protein [Sulfuricurvum sp.]|uniref:toll/interleukin-1 receptor domain-containing protein n=1 Tax=Sulfuricurvum sp. TaxID=2025608 RepID=UPI00261B6069|nr:toll/interleukin-1 receptor domain-containing protein [Sulfuricurvum sp.]MDD2267364.1 toll/interleukin-1 receptor domain-containing protein [Sulfuricurvum sp.]